MINKGDYNYIPEIAVRDVTVVKYSIQYPLQFVPFVAFTVPGVSSTSHAQRKSAAGKQNKQKEYQANKNKYTHKCKMKKKYKINK